MDLLKPEEWGNVLIQADDWFFGPDGEQYRGAYGPVHIVEAKDLLGLKPTNSANWFALIGKPGREVVIAGCRIHYAVRCTTRPSLRKDVVDLS